jgi:selenocysteine-specific elongation factor
MDMTTTTIKNVIVGTGGHIDHGKSALVEALTGTHPDRLAEEKERGITIDLGFAFLEEAGVRLGFVDVPGHERFVRNMLAGAGGIDVVLFVIAADESIKPQTREHFDICRLLGVKSGVIALTKIDLVERDVLELARLETEEFIRGSFLEGAAVVPVSVKSGEGVAELKRELLAAAGRVPSRDTSRHFRLPIDRAFAMKGFGTVVTGTLISGSVGRDEEVELFPAGRRLRVRGVQTGGKAVERAVAGQRTAVNLAGIDHHEIGRGMVLAVPGRFQTTKRLDARIHLLPSARKLKNRARVHFHQGTAETIAEVLLLASGELAPGRSAFAQLRLQDPVLVLPGDRFIVRQFSPVITIGGGVVLDALAPRHAQREEHVAPFLEILERGDGSQILEALATRSPRGLALDEIVSRTGWLEAEVLQETAALEAKGSIRIVSREPLMLVPTATFTALVEKIGAEVDKFHQANPLLPGISREELRTRAAPKSRPEVFRVALEELGAKDRLEFVGEFVKRAGAQVSLQPEEARAKEQIEAAFAEAGLAVPSVREVLAKLPVETRRSEKLLQLLLRERTLVRVTPDLVFHQKALAELRARLQEYKQARQEHISVAAFKELAGISRKYAIPLLEYLDRERVTRRAGDERVIL